MKIFLFILWVLAIVVLGALALVPNVMTIENNADKALHVAVFCCLTLWPVITVREKAKVILSVVALVVVGAGVEGLQSFAPERQSSWEDMVANIVGVLAGLVIGGLIRIDVLHLRSGYPDP